MSVTKAPKLPGVRYRSEHHGPHWSKALHHKIHTFTGLCDFKLPKFPTAMDHHFGHAIGVN